MSENNTKFKAVFTLEQDGMDGDVVSTLKFDPYPEDPDSEIVAYNIMSELARMYLLMTNVIDEDGNLVDEDEDFMSIDFDVSDQVKRHLN